MLIGRAAPKRQGCGGPVGAQMPETPASKEVPTSLARTLATYAFQLSADASGRFQSLQSQARYGDQRFEPKLFPGSGPLRIVDETIFAFSHASFRQRRNTFNRGRAYRKLTAHEHQHRTAEYLLTFPDVVTATTNHFLIYGGHEWNVIKQGCHETNFLPYPLFGWIPRRCYYSTGIESVEAASLLSHVQIIIWINGLRSWWRPRS